MALCILLTGTSNTNVNEPFCDLLGCDGDGPDHEVDGGPDGEGDVPEPEEDVDLLVDDVHGQDAEAVLVLHRAGGTVLVEGALGHLREDAVHGVHAVLERLLAHAEHVGAVAGELTAEEHVHQVDLEQFEIVFCQIGKTSAV